jgi:hypothetical protein
MKKNKILLCVTLLLAVCTSSAFAQYKHAIGGRFGTANGISYKTSSRIQTTLILELPA